MSLPVVAATAAKAAKKAAPEIKDTAKKVNEDTKGALSWIFVAGATTLTFLILKTILNASKVGDAIGDAAEGAGNVIKQGFKFSESVLGEAIKIVKDPNTDASGALIKGVLIPGTINESQAQNRAVLLLEAMNRPGTNFERVVEALSNINSADFVLIAEKFGLVRRNDIIGIKAPWPATKRNLMYWIANEADDKELLQLKGIFPELF